MKHNLITDDYFTKKYFHRDTKYKYRNRESNIIIVELISYHTNSEPSEGNNYYCFVIPSYYHMVIFSIVVQQFERF